MVTANTPGYGLYGPRVACDCLREWLPVYERMLIQAGVIKKNLDITQLTGNASASGGTHSRGGAFDIWQTQAAAVRIARQMGADATWHRTRAQGFAEHIHGVLRGCPHNGPAAYQITSTSYGVDHGRNGLANRGRDDGPRPLSGRTWRQGITWAKSQLTEKDWFDMASEADLRKIVREELDKYLGDVVPNSSVSPEERKKNPQIHAKTAWDWAVRGITRVEQKLDAFIAAQQGGSDGGGSGKA